MLTDTVFIDPELLPGAANAIHTCLRVQPGERITLITDEASRDIAASLIHEIEKGGFAFKAFVLEEFAQRPLTAMPSPILEDLARSQVSIFACVAQAGELRSRIQMTDVVNRKRIRHAHMVNISRQIMLEGMRADYHAIDELSTRLLARARTTRTIRTISKGGTDLRAEFSPSLRWIKTSGIISAEKWGNLPGGEIFTSPARVDGRFVVDGVVGDYLCERYGDLGPEPLVIDIEDSRIVRCDSSNSALVEDFSAYVMTDANSNRVGEFAIGTNIGLTHLIGNILQDEKFPGVHIAFGHPYAEHTGQTWVSSTHIDCVGRDFTIWMDDAMVMDNGRFSI
jgi:aminopeptidase